MFNKLFKKSVWVLVAMILLCSVVLTACQDSGKFEKKTMPTDTTVSGNGGVVVACGDYYYYVNGYQSNVSAENGYDDQIRTAQIVRISKAHLEELFSVNEEDLKATQKTEKIAGLVDSHVEVIVPEFYYSGNTTATALNGIYIFGDRIYITTPCQDKTASGASRTNELDLKSYKLDGSDPQKHFTFANNTVQIVLSYVDNKVVATYVLNNAIHTLDVAAGKDSLVVENVSNVNFSISDTNTDDYLFFNDENGSVCGYKAGASAHEVLAECKNEDDVVRYTYTIKSVNKGSVYYTIADTQAPESTPLYGATVGSTTVETVLDKGSELLSGTYFCWNNQVIYTQTVTDFVDKTLYSVRIGSTNDSGEFSYEEILPAIKNDTTITLNKLVGDILFYTINSITYTYNLNNLADEDYEGEKFAYSLSTTATGWSVPEKIHNYVFTLSSGSVSVVKYDGNKTNSTSVAITKVAPVVEEDK